MEKPLSCTHECVSSCEHCAFIIFNVIPESQWKAANEAHRVSPLQESAPAVYWLPPPFSSTPRPPKQNYRGTSRRRRVGFLIKGTGSLLWRKNDKSEETRTQTKLKGQKWGVGGWTKDGRCVLMCTVRWSHTLWRGCMRRPLRKGIKEGGGWYADPLKRHHSEMLTSTAINNMQQANTV